MWVAGQGGMATPVRSPVARLLLLLVAACLLLGGTADASVGDRLPEFQDCVELCKQENCHPGTFEHKNNIREPPPPDPFLRRQSRRIFRSPTARPDHSSTGSSGGPARTSATTRASTSSRRRAWRRATP
ncbi:hypothetical protein MAPG_00431 [Magnaporthiopsis poae ATCC 64411]|uniref:Uncharacterized protein n=1 Tax=Magnaporthiopsis poae (strain ATCC 64411 / 73-15) TaxID=644358 RepID=A0A0C4DKZ9_MAGP6|nr:hypothetical protein MAPG_00431 [Magnaporthiopsis poae ATCC 64411]